MPADADARAEEHRDDGTEEVGSQLPRHGQWLAVRSKERICRSSENVGERCSRMLVNKF